MPAARCPLEVCDQARWSAPVRVGVLLCLVLFFNAILSASAASSSASYSIVHDGLDAGGRTTRSTSYTMDSSLGGLAGISKAPGFGFTIGLGFSGALTPVGLINFVPVLNPLGDQTVNEGSALSLAATAIDPDGPQDTITFSLGSGAPAGTSINPTSGQFTWTPGEAQGPGLYSITVIATDSGSPQRSSSRTFSISVAEVNSPPALGAIAPQTATEGQLLRIPAQGQDLDVPANTLIYRLGSVAPDGVVIDPATGILLWTPTEAQGPSSISITIVVSDNGSPSLSASQTFNVTVLEDNSPPILASLSDQTVVEGQTLTLPVGAGDRDLPPQTLAFGFRDGVPAGVSIARTDATTGVLAWTPSEAQGPGTYTITVEVGDSGIPSLTASKSFKVTVLESNLAPEVAAIPRQTIAENGTLRFQVISADRDLPANRLEFSLGPEAPPGASIDRTTGNFSWTPTEDQGPASYTLKVIVTDDGTPASSASQIITVDVMEVNSAPALAAIADRTVEESSPLALAPAVTDIDFPANKLKFSLSADAPVGATIDQATGAFNWTPTEAQGPSTNRITISVSDDGIPSLTASQSFSVIVTEKNSPPVLADIPDQRIVEETILTLAAVASDPDIPPNTLTFSLGPGAASGITIDPRTGLLTWTPTEQQGPGAAPLTVVVTDNGNPGLSASKTFTVSVLETNRPPVPAPVENRTVDEGDTLTLTAVATDADFPANQLLFALDPGAPFGAKLDSATGAFTWTPTEAQGGTTNRIVIRVTDNGIPPATATQSFTVVVRDVNSAPVLAPIADQVIAEGNLWRLVLQASDSDLPREELTFSLGPDAPPGMNIHPKTGALTWTPIESQGPGTNQITAIVADSGAPSLSARQTFKVTVTEVNRAPVLAEIPNRIIAAGKTLRFVASVIDPDLPPNALTYILVGQVPAGAAINPSTGLFTWTPSVAQGPSTNEFNVTVGDSGIPSLSDSRTFTVVVTTGNSAPVLTPVPDQIAVEGSTLRLTAVATDADAPLDVLTFTLGPGAPPGMSIQPSTGLLTWTPEAGQVPSTNLIVITVTDSGTPRLTDARSFRVVASPLSTSPTISKISNQSVDENTPTTPIVFQVYDPDTPLGFLKLSASSSNTELVPVPNILIEGDGPIRTVALTPAANRTGVSQIRITVEDVSGEKASVDFQLTVNAIPPRILREPGALTVIAGTEATFHVLAAGSQPLNYQWRVNSAALASETNSVLVLTNVGPAAAGLYSIEVSNRLGKVVSREVRLEVSVPLGIVSEPSHRAVLAGQDTAFTVVARGREPLSYQWQFNGTDLSGATGASLFLRSVEPSDAGVYTVVVRSGPESVASAGAALQVSSPVRILTQPASFSVAAGGNALFQIEVTGAPPTTFQWQFNGLDLPGQNRPSLELTNVQAENVGAYTVLVSNPSGTVLSDKARLSLIAPPILLRPVEDKNVLAGGTVQFTASVSGAEPLQFQWLFNGAEIPGATAPQLILQNVSQTSGGRYAVSVRNPAGRITGGPAVLTVLAPVSIDRQPENRTVPAGGSVAFEVAASGTLPLAFQWRRNKVNLPGETQAALLLRPARPEDAGRYSVVVSNPAGLVESQEAALAVIEPVTLVSQPQRQSAAPGTSVRFHVVARGTPPLAYQWRRNGVDLSGETGTVLTLLNLTAGDAGTYDVIVSNPIGPVTSQAASLTVLRPPTFLSQPTGVNVGPGGNVAFTARGEGDEPLRYQWWLNGSRIPGATNPVFNLSAVQPQDAGAYSLVVENAGGVATSNPAALTLILPQIPSASSPELSPVITAADGTFEGGSTKPSESRLLGLLSLPAASGPRWFAWRAPSTGIATFNTAGSDFDTLLSVYTGPPGSLQEIASDDDRGGFLTSEVKLNVTAGVTYYLKVAGFNGAAGRIIVNHRLLVTSLAWPVITFQPQSRTVALGADATFEVRADGPNLSYEWFANGVFRPGETSSTLTVRNVQETGAARYMVRVSSGAGVNRTSVESLPAALQIGQTAQFAQDKLGHLFPPGAVAQPGALPVPGTASRPVLTGTSGALAFSTYAASREQNEPNHGGVVGGASMWVSYQSPQRGTLRVSTEGSDFDTVLAVYTASGTTFAGLKLVGSDNNSGADGRSSQVSLAVGQGTSYYIAVDGVNGATGLARLSYAVGQPPIISLQPRSFTTSEGANEALFVLASSGSANADAKAPPPSFQWFKNGLEVPGATGPALFLLNIKESDAGDYWVVVSNFAGSVSSSVARLTVGTPVRFSVSPKSQMANPGDLVVFTGLASGTGPISYEWTKNGLPIPGQSSPTLVLSNLRKVDAAEYRLVARDASGLATSDAAMLSIREAPVITAPLQNQVVSLGGSVVFAVEAIGSEPLNYQWQFNATNMPQAMGPRLVVNNAQIANQGTYAVVVANSAGTVISDPVQLVVISPLQFAALPRDRSVTEGSTAVFSATALGAGAISYQWRFNGADIREATRSTLVLAEVKASQAGKYTVLARDSGTAIESPAAVLTVVRSPIISRQPAAQSGVLGSAVTFMILAEGTEPIRYQWFLNQQPITGATNSILMLSNLDRPAAGYYSVIVSNLAGSVNSVPASLTLRQIVEEPMAGPGVFQFRLAVPEGRRARVQTSADLILWTDFVPDPFPGGTVIIEDREVSSSAIKFYRVLLE